MVDGLVPRGPRVDASARRLDLGGHLTDTPIGSALEQHVLVDVGHTGLYVVLVGASSLDPDLQGGNGSEMVLTYDHGHPVVELVNGRCAVARLRFVGWRCHRLTSTLESDPSCRQ